LAKRYERLGLGRRAAPSSADTRTELELRQVSYLAPASLRAAVGNQKESHFEAETYTPRQVIDSPYATM
jgi:hypothetical protein